MRFQVSCLSVESVHFTILYRPLHYTAPIRLSSFKDISLQRIGCILLCLVITQISLAQVIIQGKVYEMQRKEKAFVTVLLQMDSLIIKETLTDSTGYYQFKGLQQGKYKLTFSSIGFSKADTVIMAGAGTIVVDKVLIISGNQLKEVVVSGKQKLFERKIDRLVFNVENSVNTMGMDVIDLLSRTPLLNVKNDVIRIVGKEEVAVMINGKIQYLSGEALAIKLKSIPVESITRIEVITNPPAEYDAVGNSGLVNIVTKRIRKPGYSGTLNSTYIKTTHHLGRLGLDLNYNTKKVQFFGLINSGLGAARSSFRDEILYPSYIWDDHTASKEESRFLYGSVGFESDLSERTSLGVSYNRSVSKPDKAITGRINVYNPFHILDSTIQTDMDEQKKYVNQSANIHLGHQFDSTGSRIDIDADWYVNTANNESSISNINYYKDEKIIEGSARRYVSLNNNDADVYTLNSVVSIPRKKATYTFGGKVSFVKNQTDIRLYQQYGGDLVMDPLNSNAFLSKENIQALFASYANRWKKLSVKAGLRAEYTQISGNAEALNYKNKDSYLNIFPTLYLSYAWNEKHVTTVNYGRRLRRPAFASLNPFRRYETPYFYREGNALLSPYFSNNYELSHTYNDNLNITLAYSNAKNSISYIDLIQQDTNVIISRPYNFLNSSSYLLNLFYFYDKIKNFESQVDASVYYTRVGSGQPDKTGDVEGWGGNIRSVNTIYFNKKRTLTGGMVFTYQFPEVSGISRNKEYYNIDLSFRWGLMNNNLQLGLSARDILLTQNYYWSQVINGITRNSFANTNSRRLTLTARYRFGNAKMKRGRSYNEGSAEQGRIGM